MKYQLLKTALIAIGLSLWSVSHALTPLLVVNPDGSTMAAYVEGKRFMVRDATGKRWVIAGDGSYKVRDGTTYIVQGGAIVAQSHSTPAPAEHPKDAAKGNAKLIVPMDKNGKAFIKGGSNSPLTGIGSDMAVDKPVKPTKSEKAKALQTPPPTKVRLPPENGLHN